MILVLLACSSTDSGASAPEDTAVTWSTDPCAHVRGGPRSAADPVVALSEAHALVRLFGPDDAASTPDLALADALSGSAALTAPDLGAYVAGLTDACLVDADDTPLGAASVTLVGDVAWVTPGTGTVTLPEGTAAVAIDLRELAQTDGLPAALADAIGPALATDVPLADREVRTWSGFVDQVFAEANAYTTSRDTVADTLVATGTADLPLILVTGARVAPSAAYVATSLHEAGRAWIVGADVPTIVGELGWAPVGGVGVAERVARLERDGDAIPDWTSPDVSTSAPEAVVGNWADWGTPGVATGDVTRERIAKRDPWDDTAAPDLSDLGSARAALVVTHGILRSFFPYFDVVGDEIDDRLVETLPTLVDGDRCQTVMAIGRMGNAVHDGHYFFGDLDEAGCYGDFEGYFPVSLQFVDGEPVVRFSAADGVNPGDTLVARDGESVDGLIAGWREWHAGATEGYALDLAARELNYLDGDTTFTLRAPDGTERDVVVAPADYDTYATVPFGATIRGDGTLADLGAADIGYLNLDSAVTTDDDQVDEVLASGVRALVVDMRGYPAVNHYTVVEDLVSGSFSSPQFHTPTWTGPDSFESVDGTYEFDGFGTFTGPVVLLVHQTTVSAAENFATMLVGADRVTVLGHQSAGTNGNITGARLPGGFYFTFTGMQVLYPDGSTFHGVGILPDETIDPTAEDLATGADPVLARAVAILEE